ncbi:nitrogen regulation protein NR(I) [Hydrogenophilus islandicus]
MNATDEIWIVDDDDAIRWVLGKALERAHLPHRLFRDPQAVLAAAREHPPAVLVTDVRMPGIDGFTLVTELKKRNPALVALIMTAYSDLDAAVHAFQVGAFEYLPKPFDLPEAVALITRAWQTAHPTSAATPPSPPPASGPGTAPHTPELIGHSPAMQNLFRAIGRLSTSSATVLIIGETGTGKELIARALHRHSPRAAGQFVALNTAAIPRDLLEAELFGVEKGAYTGATASRPGRFEEAHGGTLFLDEIGDMPLELQTRLLRVLALGEFHRLGGRELKRVDVRIIAATHQNLAAKVADHTFREDLYHRLNVIRLTLPPLRERREDIPLLADHFLRRAAQQLGVEPKRLSSEALALLLTHPFPGNVRELENLCHWLTVMAPAATITPTDLPPEYRTPQPPTDTLATRSTAAPSTPSPNPTPAASPIANTASTPSDPHDWRTPLAAHLVARLAEREQLLTAPHPADPSAPHPAAASPTLFDTLRDEFEACLLETTLAYTHGHKQRAAKLLGVSRNLFRRKLVK